MKIGPFQPIPQAKITSESHETTGTAWISMMRGRQIP